MSASDNAATFFGESTLVDEPGAVDGLRAGVVEQTHQAGDAVQRYARDLMAPVEDLDDKLRWDPRLLATLDAIIAVLATALGVTHAGAPATASHTAELSVLAAAALAWPLFLAVSRGYRRPVALPTGPDARSVFIAGAAIITPVALASSWLQLGALMTVVALAVPVSMSGSMIIRWTHRRAMRLASRRGEVLRRSLVVGTPEAVLQFWNALAQNEDPAMAVAGVCVPAADTGRAIDLGLPVVGDLDYVAIAAANLGCHSVVVADSDRGSDDFLRKLAWSLEGHDTDLVLFPGMADVAGHRLRVESHGNLSLLHVELPRFTGWKCVAKRVTDLVLTSIGLLAISPVLGVIAVAIKINDRGPVIFRQVRIGIDGREFTMLKFRSMVVDAEQRLPEIATLNQGAGPLFKMQRDPRITRIGRVLRRFSLDELPQLFNVLAGSMSLVGPRPALPSEVDSYESHVRRRLKVLPGLTGLWQVSGRSLLTWEQTVRLDLGYVENWSIGMDLRILVKTVRAVFGHAGAF